MTTSATGDTPHSQWRKCACPLDGTQDGVCGCRYFWDRKASDNPARPGTSIALKQALTPLRQPSSTPSDPPHEICFFWYHGTCRKGDQCKLAHESHITWPRTPPPGFVHYEPCDLPLCPLRQDLVAFMEDQKRRKPRKQLGGQLDCAALSSISRSSPIEGRSSDDESTTIDVQNHNEANIEPKISLIDPNSRALNGQYSNSSELGSDDGSKEAAMKVNADPQQHNSTEPQDADSPTLTPSPATTNMDYFDLSSITPPLPSPDRDGTPLLSLSHPGTLGKRKRMTSPKEQESPSNKRQKEQSQRNRTAPSDLLLAHGDDLSPSNPPIPTGLRALGGGALICFYWYHKGHCHPKTRRNGVPTNCKYAHTLNMPVPEVSLPPMIGDHPSCSLPLCPLRSAGGTQDTPKEGMKGHKMALTENAPATPPKHSNTTKGYSFLPRDSIADARYLVKDPKHLQLPKLTEANRTRFEAQRRAVENRQVDNGVQRLKTDRQIHEEKQTRRQHKREKRMKKLRKDSLVPVLDYGDAVATLESMIPEAVVLPQRSNISDRSLTAARFTADRTEQHNKDEVKDRIMPRRLIEKSRILVDYELLIGEDRLDWDTNRIRHLFGETE
jgi:hypothetical protein